MQLTSRAFINCGSIPALYTCEGENISPPLEISGVPKGAVSLVLIMEDPDVPKALRADGMFDHWVVFNIEPSRSNIPENAPSFGIMGSNTAGSNRYFGPCPPDREHRYFFTLYALDRELDLKEGATKSAVRHAMEGHILIKAGLMGRYVKRGKHS